LGNQLLNYANLLAFRLEHPEFQVIDLPFLPYVEEYGNDQMELVSIRDTELGWSWRRFIDVFWGKSPIDPLFQYYPVDRFRHQVLHGMASYRENAQSIIGGDTHVWYNLAGDHFDGFDLADEANIKRLRSKDVSIVAGWAVRAWSLVEKHREMIRDRMQPGEVYLNTAESFVEPIREKSDRIIGVLIRQGDYRTHYDGKYFFESERYRELLDMYSESVPDQEISFLLASDESQSHSTFDDERFVFTTGIAGGDGHYIESFAELSLCDAIITPPSTFSVLAAFLSDVPIIPLYTGVEENGWERIESPLIGSVDHPEMSRSIS